MDKCPSCGGKSGYYTKGIKSHTQLVTWDGEAVDCAVDHIRGGTVRYCTDCDKRIPYLHHEGSE